MTRRPARAALAAVLSGLLCGPQALAADVERPAAPAIPSVSELPAAVSAPQISQIPSIPQTPAALPATAIPSAAPAAPAASAALAPQAAPAAPRKTILQRLRSKLALPAAAAAGAEDQRGAAERSFLYRAFGIRKPADPASAPSPVPVRKHGRNGSETGKGDDGGGSDYPRDTIVFDGHQYPSEAFRPNLPVEPLLIQAIDSAKTSLHIALYEFKLTGVLDALRRARERGVEIHIVVDFSQVYPQKEPDDDYTPRRSREIWALLREGFDVKLLRGLGQYGINHNKFVVIDHGERESLAEYGSYNWSWTAEDDHYENADFSADPTDVEGLMAYWNYLDGLAKPFDKRDDPSLYSWPASVPPPPAAAPSIAFNGIRVPPYVFSPTSVAGASAEDWIVQAINASRKSVDLAIFALRSTKIADALAAAKRRRVRVRLIMDESQAGTEVFGPYAQYLAANGIEVYTLSGPDPNADFPLAQKMHDKFAVFDGKLVETGSTNYTKYGAEGNFENAHFKAAPKSVAAFQFSFDHMLALAKAFPRPARAPALPTDAELQAQMRRPPSPRPDPVPPPAPGPGLKARRIGFNGYIYPSYAFRPDTPVEPLLVSAIDAAQSSVRLALYEFNLDGVLDALRRAKARGVKIEIVIDRSHVYTSGRDHTGQARKPSEQIQALINEGFDVLLLKGKKSGIQHNKFGLFDADETGGLLEFGSYNYAQTAERDHFENVKFTNHAADLADYLAYFHYMRGLAEPVDHEKLGEVLQRGLETEEAETDSAGDSVPGSDEGRTSKTPKPPTSTAPLFDLNGGKFYRHYFSPQGGIEDAWVRAIELARDSIDVAIFAFWSKTIADSLLAARAKNPGLKIRLVLDAGQSRLAKIDGAPVADWLTDHGFDFRMLAGPDEHGDPMFEKQHNKFLIVDGKYLITGSFNPSPNAEDNSFENDNLVDDPTDLAGYVDYFGRMFSLGWAPRAPASAKPSAARGM